MESPLNLFIYINKAQVYEKKVSRLKLMLEANNVSGIERLLQAGPQSTHLSP